MPAAVGVALFAFAARTDSAWLEHHLYQPGFYPPPADPGSWPFRGAAILAGLLFLAIAWRVRSWGALVRGALAIGLAVLVTEVVVRIQLSRRTTQPFLERRIGQEDARLGWVWKPSLTTEAQVNGRTVRYAIDQRSDRARAQELVEDPDAPTIILTGESMAFGHGLDWDEALPGILERELRVQVIDVAVSGYGTRQAALRLADARPRFRNVAATVTVFLTPELGRVSWATRRRPVSRLFELLDVHFPFMSDARLDESLRTARADLEQGGLVVFEDFSENSSNTQWLNDRLFHDLRVVRVHVPRGSLTNDNHPNAAATLELSRPIVAELRRGWQK